MSEVEVIALDKRYKKFERKLREEAKKVLKFLKREKAGLEVYLVGSPRMRAVNRESRGKNKPTNVLAFPSPDFPKTTADLLGEIYLCPPYIRRHGEDMRLLLVHGILHLTGFNHERLNDRMRMEKKEKEIITWLSR